MRQLNILVKSGFKLCTRNVLMMLSMIVFPVLSTFLVLVGYDNVQTSAQTDVCYYSAANNVYSQAVIGGLQANSLFTMNNAKEEIKPLGLDFSSGSDIAAQFAKIAAPTTINVFIYIPADIETRVQNGDSDAVVVYDTGNDQKSQVLQSALTGIMTRLRTFSGIAQGDDKKLAAMLKDAQAASLKGTSLFAQRSGSKSADKGERFALVMGVFSWFAIWGSSFPIAMIMKERNLKVYKRIRLTSVKTSGYLASKFVIGALVGVIQVALMLLSFKYIVRADYLVHLWQLGLLLFGFILVAITINLAIVSFSSNDAQINTFSIIIVNVTAMLAGGYWPLELVPQWMQNLSYYTPQRWITYTISRICAGTPYAMAEYWLVVLGFMAFFSSLAMLGFKFRARLDA